MIGTIPTIILIVLTIVAVAVTVYVATDHLRKKR
jgi:cbb3-type cytochrome oxidase subunit 3